MREVFHKQCEGITARSETFHNLYSYRRWSDLKHFALINKENLVNNVSHLIKSLTLILAVVLTGCNQIGGIASVQGSGTAKSETRSVSGFSGVVVSGQGTVTISVTGTESLTIEADDNILPLLTSDVNGGRLELGTKPNNSISPKIGPTYTLTVKSLDEIVLSGSANITATDLSATKLTVTLSGSGIITTSGQADNLSVMLSGSGRFAGYDLIAKSVSVVLSGSGTILVTANDSLDVKLPGSGNVTYKGNPSVNVDKSGSGNVSKG